jgi:hypothetical protein
MHLRAVRGQSVCDPFPEAGATPGNQNAFRSQRSFIV